MTKHKALHDSVSWLFMTGTAGGVDPMQSYHRLKQKGNKYVKKKKITLDSFFLKALLVCLQAQA